MASKYEPSSFEQEIYKKWLENNLFEPTKKTKNCKNFSITLPPPNVTGHLHLGHAWDGAIQDCIIRYKKLCGYRTIFIPGTDHAGISAQTKYEKVMKENGEDRSSISDEVFLKKLYAWATEQADYIRKQWAKLGLSLSYKNERFTLDERANKVVSDSFIKLYKDGLIYQDYKLVNWDVKLQTAISDIEVIHKETNSKLYYFKYVIEGTTKSVVVATTRPETMFGDVAVFVNPKDKRYKNLIGKKLLNPIDNEPLPVIADDYIDIAFGTGVMKCTPAHDFNDYELAKKYKLKYFSVFNGDGTLNDKCNTTFGKYEGKDRLVARNEIVNEIQSRGLVEKIEEHVNNIGYSERTNEVVEPLLSKQWFVKMAPVVKKFRAISKLPKNKTQFLPPRFSAEMERWLDKTQDWCISRQLLWGHRIPIWYHKVTNKICVGAPKNVNDYTQDKDVLDTWFSSGLWPLTLTKYAKGSNLSDFYPISMLVTGYDIIFFWVARMLFQCSYLDGTNPLSNVFFHGLIRAEDGRKMSKSFNNGIDPMDVIDEYGTDAFRAFLLSSSAPGEDLRYNTIKIKHSWAFINKIWNASNLLAELKYKQVQPKSYSQINTWIINEFNAVAAKFKRSLDKYNFIIAYKSIEDFAWEVFCNKYLEIIKPFIADASTKDEYLTVANTIFKNILIILHPYCPFVTEKIYSNLFAAKKSIMLETFPDKIALKNKKISKELTAFLDIHAFAKDLRIKNGIANSKTIHLNIISNANYDLKLINADANRFNITIDKLLTTADSSLSEIKLFSACSLEYIPDVVDQEKEKNKLTEQLKKIEFEIERSKQILSNKNFVEHAPKEKVNEEKEKAKQYKEQYDSISKILLQINKNK